MFPQNASPESEVGEQKGNEKSWESEGVCPAWQGKCLSGSRLLPVGKVGRESSPTPNKMALHSGSQKVLETQTSLSQILHADPLIRA